MHGFSTPLVFIHSPAREVSHYMQVIAACGSHAFLSVQHKLINSLTCTSKRRLPLRGASNNMQASRIHWHSSKKRLPLRGASNNTQASRIHWHSSKKRLQLRGTSNNLQVSRIPLTFEQETSSITWCKQQHACLKNSIDIRTRDFS